MIKSISDGEYVIKPISSNNHNEIKHLYDLCSDYHIMSGGREATDEDVDSIFKYSEKKTLEDSLTLGIYNKYEILIGMIDIFKNYPKDKTWMIGLLLLLPKERNKNLGKVIHEEIKKYAQTQGVDIFRIGVLEQNIRGIKFWKALGYKLEISTTITIGDKESNLSILSLVIK